MRRIDWKTAVTTVVLDQRRVIYISVAVLVLMVSLSRCYAADCLRSAAAAREASHGAWPLWSRRLPGHPGQKCWFSVNHRVRIAREIPRRLDQRRHSAGAVERHGTQGSALPAAPPLFREFDSFERERELEALIPLRPARRIDDAFRDMMAR